MKNRNLDKWDKLAVWYFVQTLLCMDGITNLLGGEAEMLLFENGNIATLCFIINFTMFCLASYMQKGAYTFSRKN